MEYLVTTKKDFQINIEQKFDHNTTVGGFTIKYNQGITFVQFGNDFFILDGFVFNHSKGKKLSEHELYELLKSGKVFPDNITGQFTIIFHTHSQPETLLLISDFVGMRHTYYGEIAGALYVSNNFTRFHEIPGIQIDFVGLLQKLSPPFYSPFYDRSLFNNIFKLLPGIYLKLGHGKKEILFYDKLTDVGTHKPNVNDIQSLLKSNGHIFNQLFEHLILPISGGVDSRITLFSIFEEQFRQNYFSLTYGEPDFVDNKIASYLAGMLSIPHHNISIKHLYPDQNTMTRYYLKGGNILLNIWVPVIEFLKINLGPKPQNTVIILGDVLDLLRAKNIKSIRTRRQRILYQLGLLSNKKSVLSSKNDIKDKIQRHLL